MVKLTTLLVIELNTTLQNGRLEAGSHSTHVMVGGLNVPIADVSVSLDNIEVHGAGVRIFARHRLTMDGVQVDGAEQNGVTCEKDGNVTLTNKTRVVGCGGAGIYARNGAGVIIGPGVEIKDCTTYGVYCEGSVTFSDEATSSISRCGHAGSGFSVRAMLWCRAAPSQAARVAESGSSVEALLSCRAAPLQVARVAKCFASQAVKLTSVDVPSRTVQGLL